MVMTTTLLPRPPRLDAKLLLILAVLIASGLSFFAAYRGANAAVPAIHVFVSAQPGGGLVPSDDINGIRSLGQPNQRWAHIYADDIDVRTLRLDGRGVVTMPQLAGELAIFGSQFITRSDLETGTENSAPLIVIAGLCGGIMGASFAFLLSTRLLARAFALRRWIARAHRSVQQELIGPIGPPAR